MRGIVFTGEGAEVRNDVEVIDPGPDEVLVRLVAAGVCHSDVSLLDGTIPWPAPSLMGHEGAGIVEAVGSLVTRVKPGDHVVIATVSNCGICDQCSVGKPTWCRKTLGNRRETFTVGGEPAGNFAATSSFAEMTAGQGGAGGPDRPRGAAHLGLPHRLRRGHRHGFGVQPGQRAAGRQRRGVRRRRRRPLRPSRRCASRPPTTSSPSTPCRRRASSRSQLGATHFINAGRGRRGAGDPRAAALHRRDARGPVRRRRRQLVVRVRRPPRGHRAGRASPRLGRRVRAGRRARARRHLRHPDHAPHPGRPRHHRQPRRRRARASATSR